MHFNKLPTEIQFDVFSTLSAKDLCRVVAPVCRRWRQFAYESTLWTSVSLDGILQSPFQITNILRHSSRIRELHLFGVFDFSWIAQLPARKSLRVIRFLTCGLTNDIMARLLDLFPYVQTFYDNTWIYGGSGLHLYLNQMVKWEFLTDIKLSGYREVQYAYLDVIAEACVNLTCIESLIMYEVHKERSFVNFLRVRGHQMRSIKFFVIEDEVTSNAYQLLTPEVHKLVYVLLLTLCRQLVELELTRVTNFTRENLLGLCELKELRYLTLRGGNQQLSSHFTHLRTKFAHVETVIIE